MAIMAPGAPLGVLGGRNSRLCGLNTKSHLYIPASAGDSVSGLSIENRIYIRGEFKESLGMNFFSPFRLKGSSKCTNHVNVHKLYASTLIQYFP